MTQAAKAEGRGKRARAQRLGPEERRAQILRIAGSCFRNQPYDAVSLDEIADEAGITRGLITHYFGNKRELYVEVVRQLVQVPELPVPAYVQGATPRSRLEESVDGWLEAIERNREIFLGALSIVGTGDPEIAEVLDTARETLARRLAEVIGVGPFDRLSPERVGLLLIWESLAEGAIRQWLVHERLSRQQVHQLIVETGVRAAEGLLDELAAAIGEGGSG